jgi:hypothetical protein
VPDVDHVVRLHVDDGRLLPYQTFKVEQEESEILLKTSDSKTNNDNQENRGRSLDEISKKTLDKTTQTG